MQLRCVACDCSEPVVWPVWFCSEHWRRIPRALQLLIQTEERRAVSDGRAMTLDWLKAIRSAAYCLATLDGRSVRDRLTLAYRPEPQESAR